MTVKKFNTRFPVDLIEEAKVEAAAMHISLNSFIVQAVMSHTAFMRSMRLKRDRQLQGSPPATALRHQDGGAWPEPILFTVDNSAQPKSLI